MKKLLSFFVLVFMGLLLFAQAPQKFTYQAVVRNGSNLLVSGSVGMRVSILQGDALGDAVYVETHTATTNANGLLTIEIGGGTVEQGSFSDIDWGNGPYFLKTETDPNGGTNYSIEGTQQLMSVPYALYAGNAGNSFSGDYNDLTNTPEIPTVPANVSAFTNDAGYITMDSVPTVPANVSAFTNDAGYITMESVPAGLTGSNTGDVMYWDAANSRWIMVPVGNPGQVLTVENGVPTWANLPDYATLILPPTVTTSAPSEVTQSSALCGGEVTSDGNVQLTACGLCWGMHHFPTTADAHTEGDLSVRAFTSHISGLAHHTTYYVRAYATNSVGTAYGAEMTFTTEDIPSDSLTMPDPCSGDTTTVWHPSLGPGSTLCAGTDSVELALDNYQYGSIQWQYSLDTVSWFDIPGAIDAQLTYMPEQTQFVRVEVSYANCPPEYSAVKFLQKIPTAYAGVSRTASIGDTIRLQANTETDATGSWQVLQGENGFLATPTEAASKFYGTDSLYRLRWTLTNACGTNSSEISVRYVQTVVSDKVVMVDTTDVIFSDSVQMSQGYYLISFSDPNIVIGDSTILVSLINDGFMRRVDSWEMRNDTTYAMYTSQASLYDILESGVIQFDAISGRNDADSMAQEVLPTRNVEFLDHIPTRRELRENPDMNGKLYVLGMEIESADGTVVDLMPRRTLQDETEVLSSSGISCHENYWEYNIATDHSLGSTSGIRFGKAMLRLDYPKVEYDKSDIYRSVLKFGYDNAQCGFTGDCTIPRTTNGVIDDAIHLGNAKIKLVHNYNGCEILSVLNIDLGFRMGNGTVDIKNDKKLHIDASAMFTCCIRYDANENKYIMDTTVFSPRENTNMNFSPYLNENESIDLDLSVKVHQYVSYFDIPCPSSTVEHKSKVHYCKSQQDNNGWDGNVSSYLNTNLSLNNAKVIDPRMPSNCSKDWTVLSGESGFSKKLELRSGNNQTISENDPLPSPICVRVVGTGTDRVSGVEVIFVPQDGGSVSKSRVITDDQGIARTQWTPGPLNGQVHQLNAYLCDCNGQPMPGAITFIANEPQNTDCANSTLQLVVCEANSALLELKVQNGTYPFTYWLDETAIHVTQTTAAGSPLVSKPESGNHVFTVKDGNGCASSKSYPRGQVSLAALSLNVETNDGTIILQGRGGTGSYQYSVSLMGGSRVSYPYSQQTEYTSLPAGDYMVYVKDGAENVVSREVTLVAYNSVSLSGCAGASTVTDYDGNVYHTLQIGSQCWMAENMRTTHYADGESIPIGAACFYPNNNSSNKSQYGLLYTWNTTTRGVGSDANPSGVQGVCPNGWHVPSNTEWTVFFNQPQLTVCPAKALATQYGWNTSTTQGSPGCDTWLNNGIGFNASPSGYWNYGYYDFGVSARFWSSKDYFYDCYGNDDYYGAYDRNMSYDGTGVNNNINGSCGVSGRALGFSVRCVKD